MVYDVQAGLMNFAQTVKSFAQPMVEPFSKLAEATFTESIVDTNLPEGMKEKTEHVATQAFRLLAKMLFVGALISAAFSAVKLTIYGVILPSLIFMAASNKDLMGSLSQKAVDFWESCKAAGQPAATAPSVASPAESEISIG